MCPKTERQDRCNSWSQVLTHISVADFVMVLSHTPYTVRTVQSFTNYSGPTNEAYGFPGFIEAE